MNSPHNFCTLSILFHQVSSMNPLCLMPHPGFPGGSDGKEFACNVGGLSSISGSGRSLGEGNGTPPLQYSCLENLMDRGAWWATVHQVSKESDTTEQQSITEPQDLQVGWVSLQSKALSRVFSNTTVQKHQLFSIQISL